MILYFSGTGNSKYCAKVLGEKLNDEVVNLFDKLRNKDYSAMNSNKPWIVVCPIYAWRIPRVVSDWMEKTEFNGCKDIYFVTTCGSEAYGAGKYLEKLCSQKELNYKGFAEVVMPGNYIIMFESPTDEVIKRDYKNVPLVLERIAQQIKNNEVLPKVKSGLVGRFMSDVVNAAFYPMFVNDKKFVANDDCISCGKCEINCPLGNIKIENGKPVWNGDCTQCMACICNCPTKAIEYGNATKGKDKYICTL